MKIDRFKFRVWDNLISRYWEEGTVQLGDDGQAFVLGMPARTPEYLNDIIIEQCTGIRDKNGRLIYEGDVVSVYNPLTESYNKCRVAWEDEIAGYVCWYLHPEKVERGCAFASTSGTYLDGLDCEIIGNIHEKGGAK